MQTFVYLYPPGDLVCNTTDAAVQGGQGREDDKY